MRNTAFFVVLVALSAMVACGPQGSSEPQIQPDSASGGDDTMTGARGVFDEAVNDDIDATAGDNTDMKYVDIDGRGTLNLRVRFHAPDVAGTVTLMNEFGDVLREATYAPGNTDVRIDDFDVFPGRYYVRVYASQGKSDYTVGQEFVGDANYLSAADIAWRDEQIALARTATEEGRFDDARAILDGMKRRFPENTQIATLVDEETITVDVGLARSYLEDGRYDDARSVLNGVQSRFPGRAEISEIISTEIAAVDEAEEESRSRRRSRRSSRSSRPAPEPDTTVEPSETEPAPEPEEQSIRAGIITIRDRGAGSGTTLILTGCGTSSGLSEGDRGRIGSTGHRATIIRMTGSNSCEAESSASAGEIGSANTVTF